MHVGKIRAARDRVLERIEVDDHHIDRTYPVRLQGFSVRGIAANREQPAVHRRMQGLDAAVHHLGEAGQLGNVDDREPRLAQRLARAAGGDEFDAVAGKRAGELDDPGLVGNGDESARGAAQIFGHGGPCTCSLIWSCRIAATRESSIQKYRQRQLTPDLPWPRAGTASRAATAHDVSLGCSPRTRRPTASAAAGSVCWKLQTTRGTLLACP